MQINKPEGWNETCCVMLVENMLGAHNVSELSGNGMY